jgi:NAD(P)-dependent dehydrogenase (short-subunit alcohol dehydrogenase family)
MIRIDKKTSNIGKEGCVLRYALITGANGGLGRSVVEQLIAHGYYVFAADIRPPSPFPKANFHPLTLDITDGDSVARAFAIIKSKTLGLDLVVNLAGYTATGPLIEQNPEVMKQILNVRLVGPMCVNKEAFPFVSRVKGRYINVSSDFARSPVIPFNAYYAVANRAIEAYNEGLRRETAPFGVKVILLRPGSFATPLIKTVVSSLAEQEKLSNHYRDALGHVKRMMERDYLIAAKPALFAKTILKAAINEHPKKVYNIHRSLRKRLAARLPIGLLDRFYGGLFD